MSLQNRLRYIGAALAQVTTACHYWRPNLAPPFLVWAEESSEDFFANGRNAEQKIAGTVDFYTKTEFDPTIDAIQEKMEEIGLTYTIDSVQYEDETNLIHYSWNWWQ